MLNILECSADEIFCDVVDKSSMAKSSELSEKLDALPIEEKKKIYDVIDTMIKKRRKVSFYLIPKKSVPFMRRFFIYRPYAATFDNMIDV